MYRQPSVLNSPTEAPAFKSRMGWEGPEKGNRRCDASYPVANVLSTIVDSAGEVPVPNRR